MKCPLCSPFIPSLAAAVLDGAIWQRGAPDPHELPQITIYLPTHAAVEPLKLAFLAHSPNGATFLPRIRVLGDADPLDLFAAYGTRMPSTPAALRCLENALKVPAAFDELERQVELAALVLDAANPLRGTRLSADERVSLSVTPASAITIAGQIAALVGEAHAEGAALPHIAMLDGAHASGREQLSLRLLRAVLAGWQAHKARTGKLDREERRNRLMAIEAEFIRESDTPIIVAGSTGSIAATVGLMEAALSRPRSAIVLHGLDEYAGESWEAVPSHPEHWQHGLRQLLARLNIRPEDIRALPSINVNCEANPPPSVSLSPSPLSAGEGERPPHPVLLPEGRRDARTSSAVAEGVAASSLSPLGERAGVRRDSGGLSRRAIFLSQALRPPAAADWASFIQTLKEEGRDPAPGLSLIEAATIQDEAAAIALILRDSLETPGQTAALVTPSESLISRVRHTLAQWGVAAAPAQTHCGDGVAARALSCAASGKPEEFVELLRQAGEAHGRFWRTAEVVDLGVLRQMWRPSSLEGIPNALSRAGHAIASGEARHPAMKRIASAEWEAARCLATQLIEAFSPLTAGKDKRRRLPAWVAAHQAVLTTLRGLGLSAGGEPQENSALKSLEQAATPALAFDIAGYAGFFAEVLSSRPAASLESQHPRLFLWKPLDARLLTADIIVLGGLNEGCWPQATGPDPWLSRRDRAFAGLPPRERRVGQAAHDFATLAASGRLVILTRSKKVNGTLARPSRWISRIEVLAAGAGQGNSLKPGRPWLDWAVSHCAAGPSAPVSRPQPRPPLAARPRRLSVTAIETWLANPYAIYARHILGLEPLRRLDETSDARDKGILYHAALHGFFQAYPTALPENAAKELLRQLDAAAGDLGFNLENAPFWKPRFARFAEWFAETESERRAGVELLKSEAGGKLRLNAPAGPFDITARADRIDVLGDGSLRIYDFKTSANTAKVSAGRDAPQLALEGLLAREGAFAGIPANFPAGLCYIVATGGEPPGEIVAPKRPPAEAIEAAQAGTVRLIARFDDEAAAYEYAARAIYRDKADNDPYAHLARVREWSAGADETEAGDD